MNRRHFGRLLAGLSALQGLTLATSAHADKPKNAAPVVGDRSQETLESLNTFLGGDAMRIGIVVYPGMVLQDVVGLTSVFQSLAGSQIHLIGKSTDPVGSGDPEQPALITVTPTVTLDKAPKELDVLIVPGGLPGKYAMMEDPEVLDFLKARAPKTRYMASVGTGSLVLGAAGLLQGYKATTYWPMRGMLKELGATQVSKRVVVDRNRITAGGTTASLDLGLTLIEMLRNPAQAQLVQLYLEYDPQPPYKGGSPEKAPPKVTSFMTNMYAGLIEQGQATSKRAMQALKDAAAAAKK